MQFGEPTYSAGPLARDRLKVMHYHLGESMGEIESLKSLLLATAVVGSRTASDIRDATGLGILCSCRADERCEL